jgi:hypothetical protein
LIVSERVHLRDVDHIKRRIGPRDARQILPAVKLRVPKRVDDKNPHDFAPVGIEPRRRKGAKKNNANC